MTETLENIAKNLDIELILLFGSRADGRFRKDSDFDVAYISKKPLESDLDLFHPLMDYLGSDNLHIVNMKGIKPLFLYEIMNNCKVLYAKNMMDFYNLRVYAFRRFHDEVKPLYNVIFERFKKEYLYDNK